MREYGEREKLKHANAWNNRLSRVGCDGADYGKASRSCEALFSDRIRNLRQWVPIS